MYINLNINSALTCINSNFINNIAESGNVGAIYYGAVHILI